jgi:hypothetical protein
VPTTTTKKKKFRIVTNPFDPILAVKVNKDEIKAQWTLLMDNLLDMLLDDLGKDGGSRPTSPSASSIQ